MRDFSVELPQNAGFRTSFYGIKVLKRPKKNTSQLKKSKLSSKFAAFARDQGASRLKSGAYTIVREHFELACNTGIGQKMGIWDSVLAAEIGLLDLRIIQQFS